MEEALDGLRRIGRVSTEQEVLREARDMERALRVVREILYERRWL